MRFVLREYELCLCCAKNKNNLAISIFISFLRVRCGFILRRTKFTRENIIQAYSSSESSKSDLKSNFKHLQSSYHHRPWASFLLLLCPDSCHYYPIPLWKSGGIFTKKNTRLDHAVHWFFFYSTHKICNAINYKPFNSRSSKVITSSCMQKNRNERRAQRRVLSQILHKNTQNMIKEKKHISLLQLCIFSITLSQNFLGKNPKPRKGNSNKFPNSTKNNSFCNLGILPCNLVKVIMCVWGFAIIINILKLC